MAIRAKENTALMATLWDAVERLIGFWARRYISEGTDRGTRLYEADDLIQASYLALVDAVDAYDPDKGELTTILRFYVQTAFAEVSGRRGSKLRPEIYAASLDAPLYDDNDTTRGDMLTNTAADFTEDIIEREAIRQDCAAIRAEIDKLPDKQRMALMLTEWDDKTLKEAAETIGVNSIERVRQLKRDAARNVRRTRAGELIAKEYKIRRVSISEFKRTGISEVEWAVFYADYQERLTRDLGDL